jgi:iron complex transport system permease protein
MSNWQRFFTRQNKKIVISILVVLMIISVGMSIAIGAVHISLKNLIAVFMEHDTESTYAKIILYSRLPRTCAAVLAGAALGVSGMVIQTVLNNPLASSNVIGVNSGAGFAVALVCAVSPAMQKYTPVVAFLGALASVLLVMFLSQSMAASKLTVVLAGVAISNLFGAGIDAVVTFVPDALNGVTDFKIGGFEGVTMTQLKPAMWMIFVCLLILLSLSRQLDILSLGSDTAKSLGLAVGPMRVVFLVLAAALAGAAVSFSGLLGFIGLIVPHAMRKLVGEESSILL